MANVSVVVVVSNHLGVLELLRVLLVVPGRNYERDARCKRERWA